MPTEKEIRQRRKEKFDYDGRQERRSAKIQGDHLADDPVTDLDEGYQYPRELRALDIKRQAKPHWKWVFRFFVIATLSSAFTTATASTESVTVNVSAALFAFLAGVLLWLLLFTKPITES